MKDSKIYEAESRVFKKEEILTKKELEKFFSQMVNDKWFIEKYGKGYSLYTVGNFFGHSFACKKQIYMFDNEHYTKSSICHEQAHAVKNIRGNPHGKAWQKRYIEMVERYISKEKARQLEKEFAKIS